MEEIISTVREFYKKESDGKNSELLKKYFKFMATSCSTLLIICVMMYIFGNTADIYYRLSINTCLLLIYIVWICWMLLVPIDIYRDIKREAPSDIIFNRVVFFSNIILLMEKFSYGEIWKAYQFLSIEVSQLENRMKYISLGGKYMSFANFIISTMLYVVMKNIFGHPIQDLSALWDQIKWIFIAFPMCWIVSIGLSIWVQNMKHHVFILKVALILKKEGELPLDMGKMVDPTFS